jgi:hypothetical protein
MIKGGTTGKWRKKVYYFDYGFAGSVGLASCACVAYAAMIGAGAFRAFDRGREGAVAFNSDCNALHVNVSPWRYYLDVEYDLPLRVARMWFNS